MRTPRNSTAAKFCPPKFQYEQRNLTSKGPSPNKEKGSCDTVAGTKLNDVTRLRQSGDDTPPQADRFYKFNKTIAARMSVLSSCEQRTSCENGLPEVKTRRMQNLRQRNHVRTLFDVRPQHQGLCPGPSSEGTFTELENSLNVLVTS